MDCDYYKTKNLVIAKPKKIYKGAKNMVIIPRNYNRTFRWKSIIIKRKRFKYFRSRRSGAD